MVMKVAVLIFILLNISTTGFTGLAKVQKRIMNAEIARFGQFPFAASFVHENEDGEEKEIFCSGSLISSNRVLSEKSCFDDVDMKKVTAIFGVQDTNQESPFTQRRKIASHVFNDDKSAIVLKLSSDVYVGNYVKPIKLLKEKVSVGQEITLIGYGLNEFLMSSLYYKPTKIDKEDGDRFCSSSIGTGVSAADMGGPAIILKNNEYYLVGIINSFSKPAIINKIEELKEKIRNRKLSLDERAALPDKIVELYGQAASYICSLRIDIIYEWIIKHN